MQSSNHYYICLFFLLQKGIYDEALQSFFRNVDSRNDTSVVNTAGGLGKIHSLKARVSLIH